MKKDRNAKDDTEEITKGTETQITELTQSLAVLNDKYLRSLADYQNLERQTQIWREEFVKYASQGLITQLLEILDDLENALGHLNDPGLGLIVDKLKTVLKNNGVEELVVLETDFDPSSSEAVEVVPGPQDNKIVAVLRRGYRLHGKVLRPAKVRVSKKQEET